MLTNVIDSENSSVLPMVHAFHAQIELIQIKLYKNASLALRIAWIVDLE